MSETASTRQGFWEFSLSVYADEAVKSACLELQAQGLNVNISLWTIWTCRYGRDPRPALKQAIEQSAIFNSQVVQPLRQARSSLKPPPTFIDTDRAATLRQSILSVELEAEHLEQASLEQLARNCPEHGLSADLESLIYDAMRAYAEALKAKVETREFVKNVLIASKIVY